MVKELVMEISEWENWSVLMEQYSHLVHAHLAAMEPTIPEAKYLRFFITGLALRVPVSTKKLIL